MSSDVITQPTWNRLQVARRVSDMAKSMIRLSRLGLSIFPMSDPRAEAEEPAARLKVSEKAKKSFRPAGAKPIHACLVQEVTHGIENVGGAHSDFAGPNRGLSAHASSSRISRARLRPRAGHPRHG